MAEASQQSFPLNMEELERLVKKMHAPGNPKEISEASATLQVLQRSPQGWEMGDALLSSDDENSRFFGALTFTIKINADAWVLSLSRLLLLTTTVATPSVRRIGPSCSSS